MNPSPLRSAAWGFSWTRKAADAYRLHFFEISIRGKNSHGNDVALNAEVVAIREESGQREVVPADVLIDLVPHPHHTSQ